MKFSTPWEREVLPDEINSGERLVETAGYVPIQAQIAQFINAGKRLQDYRNTFDFDAGKPIPEDFIDPTKRKGFDIIDAQMVLNGIQPQTGSVPVTESVTEPTIKPVAEPAKGD